ncbi:hypothetical protein ANCCAN_23181 [Ancylostoma caninum]|uniref:Uncharacterized protein n=1 Tax=Ancylostoma caninum TaxID=29170 RepID=A0A368FFS3_ANCCA|nr:hypothetical protein ANCCAN_23181 [Ancylostoma caninum]
MSDKEKELCPRLIDYLVVVGKRNRIRLPLQEGPVTRSAIFCLYVNGERLGKDSLWCLPQFLSMFGEKAAQHRTSHQWSTIR